MKTHLITGIGGSIAIHVLGDIMTNTDDRIVGIDSFRYKGFAWRLERTFRDHPDWKDRVKIIHHDLACPINESMRLEIGHVDYILHLAALSDVWFSVENPVFVMKNNIDSTITMLEYAKETPHEAFVYFSTDEVYGPVAEGEAHVEWDAHRPSNAYAASKAASEDLCYPYWRKGEVKLILTNTMNNYGEMQSSSKFPVLVHNAIQNDEEVVIHGTEDRIGSRFYIHSREVGRALRFILAKGARLHKVGEIDDPHRYHIVGKTRLNNLELAQKIAKLMGKTLKYRFVDFHSQNPAHDLDYGLQNNNLRDFEEAVPFDESMTNTLEFEE